MAFRPQHFVCQGQHNEMQGGTSSYFLIFRRRRRRGTLCIKKWFSWQMIPLLFSNLFEQNITLTLYSLKAIFM